MMYRLFIGISNNCAMSKRLVVLPWSCSMTADCCKAVSTVLMTPLEAQEIVHYIGSERTATLKWRMTESPKFIRLVAHPCPLLDGNLCSVHPVRPYNCRRWGCFRPDVAVEALEPDHSFLGCANARERFMQDHGVRRQLKQMQRKAQKWARRHGWTEDGTEKTGVREFS